MSAKRKPLSLGNQSSATPGRVKKLTSTNRAAEETDHSRVKSASRVRNRMKKLYSIKDKYLKSHTHTKQYPPSKTAMNKDILNFDFKTEKTALTAAET